MWEDVRTGDATQSVKMEYVKLSNIATVLRVLSAEPFSRYIHWLQRANGGKGTSVRCLGAECPVCSLIKEAKAAKATAPYNTSRKHTLLVLTRADNTIKLLEGGNTLFQQLKSIKDEGIDIYNMDIKITKLGAGTSAAYTILPVMNAVGPVDLTGLEGADFDIQTLNQPLKVEQVKALMQGATWDEIREKPEATEDAPQG